MRRKYTADCIKVMQAYVEGKQIQYKDDEVWINIENPDWDWHNWEYRIKPEFKDGDILYATDWINGYIYITKGSNPDIATCYCYKVTGGGYLHICNLENHYDCTLPSITIKEEETRFATESEKQQLFDALAKENKRWDAEKKAIVDLPKDTELRPTLSKYRIKPEPKYRTFANAEECIEEMKKHQPFGWIKCKGCCFNIAYVNNAYVGLADPYYSSISLASKNSYQDNTFLDGTPFGINIEEE